MAEQREIVVIHTNDLHGRLDAAAEERLRALIAQYDDPLVLDAGDAVAAGNLGCRPGGEPILARMSDLGYHAMTLGNRESHPRREIFPRKLAEARFPVLCANITARPGVSLPVRPHAMFERSGARVAVFGVTVAMFTRKQWSAALCDYFFADPIAIAPETARALRPEADVVIALTHIGYAQDLALARGDVAADLIIGGHSHTDLVEPALAGGTPIVQAGSHGFFAGVARLRIGAAGVELASWEKVALRDDAPRRERV